MKILLTSLVFVSGIATANGTKKNEVGYTCVNHEIGTSYFSKSITKALRLAKDDCAHNSDDLADKSYCQRSVRCHRTVKK